MEDGCPMPEAGSDRLSERAPDLPGRSMFTPAGSLHDCVFAEACLNASPAVIPRDTAFRSLPLPHQQSFRVVRALHGSEELPPPIPPPNF